VTRKHTVFKSALDYAVELGYLRSNPLNAVRWKAPRSVQTVDRRVVVSPAQARQLLAAVNDQPHMAPRLVAFFGSMYYAATRPAETAELTRDSLVSLPDQGWGEMLLSGSLPEAGAGWTDGGTTREARGLKHRATRDTRPVPVHPELVRLFREHIDRFGVGRKGRLFVGPRGGLVYEKTYLAVWREARRMVLGAAAESSLLARRPYDLRHAAVSTWLNAGVDPTQVAEWAGHSVPVLLHTYAKCVDGRDEVNRRRIEEMMRPEDGA
jgi:integrase